MNNHLWQSTLFAAVVGLLALALRQNRAQVRFWLWLSASIKFFVPFVLLLNLGSQLEWAPSVTEMATPVVALAVEQIAQPFPVAPSPVSEFDWTPVLLGVWTCGVLTITVMRLRAWHSIRAVVRGSSSLDLGLPVEVRSTIGLLEPGVVGLLHPILLLPAGIERQLTTKQLDAVFAHELCHVRRRDNLFASIHMIVEAIFWFHPLVWWIGSRLVEERERACDEEVLRLGGEPQIYAEAILSICKLYVESPLACVSGVTGANLKKRIEAIMKNRTVIALSFYKKTVLTAAAIAALAGPVLTGMLSAQVPLPPVAFTPPPPPPGPGPPPAWVATSPEGAPKTFEVASIRFSKPGALGGGMRPAAGSLTASSMTVEGLAGYAYGMRDYQILGATGWARSERYDINAKAFGAPDLEHLRLLLQALLTERFKLAVHRETRDVPIYILKVEPRGLKMKTSVGPAVPGAPQMRVSTSPVSSREIGDHATITQMVSLMARTLGRPVVDQTGLKGEFDFLLEWTPDADELTRSMPIGFVPTVPDSPLGVSLFTAIREQLGLRLESAKGPGVVLLIDSVQRPSEN